MRLCESSLPENQRLSNPGQVRSAKSGGRPTNSTIDPPIQSNPLQLQCIADVEVQKRAITTFIDTCIFNLILMVACVTSWLPN